MNLLDLVVKITCDDQASSKVEGIGSKITSILGTAAKVGGAAIAALGTATIAVGKTALDAYADYEQLVGGIDTLFGGASAKMQQYAAQAYQTAGTSANKYMEISTSFAASLISSLGGDTQKAADMANMAIQDMSDNANKMGTSLDVVQEAYQSLARGNYEMLDSLKLGYGGTKEQLQQLLDDAEDIAASQGMVRDYSIDSYADIVEAIHLVQGEMGITGTTAAEASKTISGAVNQAKAAWENWLAGLGNENADMGALTDSLVQSIITAANNIVPRVGVIFSTLADVAAQYAPDVGNALVDGVIGLIQGSLPSQISGPLVDAVNEIRDTVSSLFSGFSGGESFDVSGVLDGIGSVIESISEFASSIDFQAVFSGLADIFNTIGSAASTFGEALQTYVLPAFSELGSAVGPFIEALGQLVEALSPVINFIVTGVAQWVAIFTTGIGQIVGAITTVIGWITTFVTSIMNAPAQVGAAISGIGAFFASLPGLIGGFLSQAVNALLGFVGQVGSAALQAGSRFLSSIQQKFNEAVSFVSSIPGAILNALGNLGGLLYDAGASIISGLINGIKSMVGSVINTVSGVVGRIRDFFPFSPAKRGPFSGHGYTTWSGRAMMHDWADSIKRNGVYAVDAIRSVMDDMGMARGLDTAFTFRTVRSAFGSGTYNNYYIGDTEVTNMSDAQFAQAFVSLMMDYGRLART